MIRNPRLPCQDNYHGTKGQWGVDWELEGELVPSKVSTSPTRSSKRGTRHPLSVTIRASQGVRLHYTFSKSPGVPRIIRQRHVRGRGYREGWPEGCSTGKKWKAESLEEMVRLGRPSQTRSHLRSDRIFEPQCPLHSSVQLIRC